jgi:hypothetical protein
MDRVSDCRCYYHRDMPARSTSFPGQMGGIWRGPTWEPLWYLSGCPEKRLSHTFRSIASDIYASSGMVERWYLSTKIE